MKNVATVLGEVKNLSENRYTVSVDEFNDCTLYIKKSCIK